MFGTSTTDARGSLLGHELALLSSAGKYNLDDRRHRHDSNVSLVSLFFNLIEIIGVDLFIEAGAKDAAASRRMKAAHPAVRVVAFEANPYTYASFKAVNTNNGVEYLHFALSDHPGPVIFNLHQDEHGSPIANGQASLFRRQKSREDLTRGFIETTVDGVTLDTFFANHQFGEAALWIDVEGACSLVLPGARNLLAKSAVLMVEVEEQRYWGEGHWLRDQVISYLFDLGLVPVARDYEYEFQYNIVFVRSDLLSAPTRINNELARFLSAAYPPPANQSIPASTPRQASPPQPRANTWQSRVRKQIHRTRKSLRRIFAGRRHR